MTKDLKQELESKGIKVIQNWHIVLAFIGMIFIAGVSFGVNQNRVSNVEIRQNSIEIRQNKLEQDQKTMDEIKINLKFLMESQGLKYQPLK